MLGRLLIVYLMLMVLTGVVGWVGITQAQEIYDRARRMYVDDVLGTADTAELRRDAGTNYYTVVAYITAPNAGTRAELQQTIGDLDRQVDSDIDAIQHRELGRTQLAELARFTQAWSIFKRVRDNQILPAARATNSDVAETALSADALEQYTVVRDLANKLIQSNALSAEANDQANLATFQQARSIILGLTGAALLLGVATIFSLARLVRRIAIDYNRFLTRVAQGDLTARLPVNGQDEISILSMHMNKMAQDLGSLSSHVRDNVHGISSATAQIFATVSRHTASVTEQSAAIEETTVTVDAVRNSAEQAAQKAEHVVQRADMSVRASQDGIEAAAAILRSMEDIRTRVEAIAQGILALNEQTQQIGEITASVSDIADQSNLLALNATIEAARAGEQGKGFAVVAAEVRNLAEQSKQATARVRTILSEIQKAANAAVMATEQGSKGVEAGSKLAQHAGSVFGQMSDSIRDVSQAARQIAAAAHQQNAAMDQIADAMRDIQQATSQFVAGAGESRTAAEGLNDMAHELQTLTARYQVA